MNVDKDFSLGSWYKYNGSPGSLITLKTSGGAVYFDLRVTAAGFTVTLGG